jgi:transcription antitermination factor NusG
VQKVSLSEVKVQIVEAFVDQPYLSPEGIFLDELKPCPRWSCVRTKPRSEKRLADWLRLKERPFYLPTQRRETISHRRVRRTDVPLFPGYLFLGESVTKSELRHAPGFVDILTDSSHHHEKLGVELASLWRGLCGGSPLEVVHRLEPGDLVEVVSGSMKGTIGNFQSWGRRGRLTIWVSLLGAGAAVEIDEACVERVH